MNTKTSPSFLLRPGIILSLVCLPVFIGALDLTIVSAVLPNVILDLEIPFQTGMDDAAWMVSGYLLAYTVSVAVMGRISDIIGRRRTYFLALLIFVLGSWLVAVASFAPTEWMRSLFRIIQGGRPDTAYMSLYALIAGRIIQALGAGAMVPVSMALVGDLYPPANRATALGVVGAVDTAGWVLGHLYGGLMVQFVEWPILFWINIPITTIIAYITWRLLEPTAESHEEGGLSSPAKVAVFASIGIVNLLSLVEIARAAAPEALFAFVDNLIKINWLTILLALVFCAAIILTLLSAQRTKTGARTSWVGAILISITLTALNLGLGGSSEIDTGATLTESSALPPYATAALIVSAVAFIAYIITERKSTHPLFALSHFKNRNVSLATYINLMVGFCLMVGLVSVPLFINAVVAETLDEAALLSGVLLGSLTIPMALAGVPGGILTDRVGYRIPTVLGLVLAAIGFSLGRTWTPDMPLTTMGFHMVIAGVGLGLTEAPIGTTVINAVKNNERGIASALVLIMRLIGMTFGTSIMTAYGVRRIIDITENFVSELADTLTPALTYQFSVEAATTVINEMLFISAVICIVTILPALFISPKDILSGDGVAPE